MRVLIAYDGSEHAKAAIEDLRRAGLPRQIDATVVTVAHAGWPHARIEGEAGPFDSSWTATMKEAEAIAEEGKGNAQSLFPAWSIYGEALWGDPAAILRKTIDVLKPDLVVVGSHGRSLPARLLLGSVSSELVHHASCSVRVVRSPRVAEDTIRILIATDGSQQGQACVDAVARRSWPKGTSVRILAVMQPLVPVLPVTGLALEARTLATEPAARVIEESDARERVKLRWTVELGADRLRQAGLITDTKVLDGDPRYEISAEAERWNADTVFVGARGLGALDRVLLGSVSTAVVHHAPCAVEVVRHSQNGA